MSAAASFAGPAAAWTRLTASEDANARMYLIEHYAWLARVGAGRFKLPANAEFTHDDLYGHAIIGLIDAIDKYEPSKGRAFEAYATLRIKGAIVDALRKADWMPRGLRQTETRLREAMARIELKEGRSASDEELCREMEITPDELQDLYGQLSVAATQSLEELLTDAGELNCLPWSADNPEEDPAARAQVSQVRQILRDAVEELADQERSVIALYYFEEMTLKEIGAVLGLTESRVCQIHTKAILRLQTKLACWLDVMFMAA